MAAHGAQKCVEVRDFRVGERGSMLLAQLDVLEQELKQVVGADEDELGNRMIMMMMLFNGRRHGS